MLPRRLLAIVLLCASGPALAQQATPPTFSPAERAARRFPQPVRVGDLIDRQVLRPIEQQTVVGRVAAVVRLPDGALFMVVKLGGALGLGTRPVAVPVDAMVLLGPYVEVKDLSPKQLRELPTFEASGTTPVGADEVIRVGLARPSH